MARPPSRGVAAQFRPRRRPTPPSRGARLAGRAAAGLIALLIVALGGLWTVLQRGPIDVTRLAPRIEAAAALGTSRLEIGAARIALAVDGAPLPGLEVDDLRLVAPSGRVMFAAPRARIDVSPLDLLDGRFHPRRVTARGVSIVVARGRDGAFSVAGIGLDGDAGTEAAAPLAAQVAVLEALGEVALADVSLVYDDRTTGRRRRVDGGALRMRRTADGVVFSVSARTAGKRGRIAAAFSGTMGLDGAGRASGTVAGLSPADFVALAPGLDGLAAIETDLTLDVSLETAPGLAPAGLDFHLAAGPGAVTLGGVRRAFARFEATAAVDPVAASVSVDRLALDADAATLEASGTLTRGADGAAVFDMGVEGLEVRDPALLEAPAAFDGGRLLARIAPDVPRIEIAEARLERGDAAFTATGDVARDAAGWRGALSAQASGLPVADVAALWPPGVAPGARRWIAANMTAGVVDRLDAGLVFDPETAGFGLSFAFTSATAHYFRPLPPIDGASGWATIDGDRFSLTIDGGGVTAPDGGRVDLAGSSVAIPAIFDPDPAAEIDVVGAGPLPSILGVLDMAPLGFVSELGLAPDAVAGAAEATARLRLPLRRDLPLAEVSARASATLRDVALSPPGLGVSFTADRLALGVDTDGLTLSGDGALDGAPVTVVWRERFRPGVTAMELSASPTVEDLARFGLDLGPAAEGRAAVRATLNRAEGAPATLDLDVDLADLALDAAPLPWRKTAGSPGRLRLVARPVDGGFALESFDAEAPGLSAAGSARIGAGGRIEALTLSRARVADAADVTLDLAREADVWRAQVGGAFLDLARLADGLADGGGTAFSAEIAVERLGLGPVTLAPGSGVVEGGAEGVQARFDGRVGDAGAVRVALGETAPGALRIEADDAGAFLSGAGFFARGVGGRLLVEAETGPPLAGRAQIDGMRVVGSIGLARLADAADAAEAAQALRETGVAFDRIAAGFRVTDDGVALEDGLARSPLIGATFAGRYDAQDDALDIEGVLTPFYAVNTLLGGVPLIGDLLTGGAGEGVFAFNYRVSGSASDPQVSVNPFSGITPGFLRRIFEGDGVSEAQVEAERRRQRLEDRK
jgi:hypothetical protein